MTFHFEFLVRADYTGNTVGNGQCTRTLTTVYISYYKNTNVRIYKLPIQNSLDNIFNERGGIDFGN